ncbi:MAG TPA: FAD/NAD(P)-binding oxidoreductase [Gammaproteobacteria bacterium]|jgi:sulfide:quinone oxidoreductase|nr:FAD/NAD(P)-binding oxidoreductase [Gammaproteobacteria bacterium]
MAQIIVLGAGTGGVPAAYELQDALGRDHKITLINASGRFQFVPSNPWIAVGWRKPAETSLELAPYLAKRGIEFVTQAVTKIAAAEKYVELADGTRRTYDFLVIATGPKLAFEEIPGFGRDLGYTESICTLEHAETAYRRYQEFLENPGHIVVGAVQGASCFGPAYEFAMILDADLRRRKLRHKVPMTFVTSEPYIGHMGLAGVGDSKGLMESEFRQRHIQWITNAAVNKLEAGKVHVTEHDAQGQPVRTQVLDAKLTMLLPAFKGVDAVAAVEGLCNPRGFVLVDDKQRNPKYPGIYAAGVCIAIPPIEKTPVPTGAPKTGYMIESMVSAIVANISAELRGETPQARATMNAICLADAGDEGIAFVALPELPPRNLTWAKKGKWVHLAKVAFEKYFLHKVKSGNTDPVYERYVLKALGIERLQS